VKPYIVLGRNRGKCGTGEVLKMNCESDVILNDYEHVRLFDEVYFEYHAFITKIPVRRALLFWVLVAVCF
jgi:hypothetical protein